MAAIQPLEALRFPRLCLWLRVARGGRMPGPEAAMHALRRTRSRTRSRS